MEKSGPREGAEGVVEGLKGKAKETVGALTDDEKLEREGRAQQDKARAQRDAAGKEAEAEKARAAARAYETEPAVHQHR
ncbi:MAG TPA: CsbD family protein [Acidimicrobiales bacterium]|nr:CsbD family protein [Acidimicrobiales bacterium]